MKSIFSETSRRTLGSDKASCSDIQFPEDEQNLRGDVFTTMPMIVESFLRDFKKTIDMDVYVRVCHFA
jgi:hypothetical protein